MQPQVPAATTPRGPPPRLQPGYNRPRNPLPRVPPHRTPPPRPPTPINPAPPTLQDVLHEMRRYREETMKEFKKVGQMLNRLEENYKSLRDELNQQASASFTIETSSFKVCVYTTLA